jgi:hypothetical protein
MMLLVQLWILCMVVQLSLAHDTCKSDVQWFNYKLITSVLTLTFIHETCKHRLQYYTSHGW